MEDLSFKHVANIPETLEIGRDTKDVMSQLNISHPLQMSELKYPEQQLSLNSQMIRNHQGIGAQLKYMMEINATTKTGRMPFLPSSNASRDALLGTDEIITPMDVYGSHEFSEKVAQPHAVMEKFTGIL